MAAGISDGQIDLTVFARFRFNTVPGERGIFEGVEACTIIIGCNNEKTMVKTVRKEMRTLMTVLQWLNVVYLS